MDASPSAGAATATVLTSFRAFRDEVAIKVIAELQAKPGRRAELESLLESIVAELRPSQRGFLGSTRYEAQRAAAADETERGPDRNPEGRARSAPPRLNVLAVAEGDVGKEAVEPARQRPSAVAARAMSSGPGVRLP